MGMKRFTRLLSATPLQLASLMSKSWKTEVKLNRISGMLWWKYMQNGKPISCGSSHDDRECVKMFKLWHLFFGA